MESRWEFTAPQFVDFAAMDLDDDLEEDKFFDVNNETRDEEEEERVRVKLPFPTPGFQSCNNSDEEDEENVVKVQVGDRQKFKVAGSSKRALLTAPKGQQIAKRGVGRNMAKRNLLKASASRFRASFGSSRGPVAVLNAQKKDIVGKKTGADFQSQAEQVARFQKATPLRFRSQPLGGCYSDASGQEIQNKARLQQNQPRRSTNRNGEVCGGVPARQQLPTTEPTPFQLEGSKRLQQRAAAWQEEVARKQELERQAHKFKAKEAVVLRAAPFALQLVQREREPTIQGPDLCTDRRAMEREKFEAKRKEREARAEAIRLKEQEEKYQEELQEVAHQRKQAVHKARPVPKYARLEVLASDKKLTTATSLYLLTKRNARGSKC